MTPLYPNGDATPDPSAWRGLETTTDRAMDPACVLLCQALNTLPGITTTESCCGHHKNPYWIWFTAASLEDLPAALYYFDACHGGYYGWLVRAITDCARSPVRFVVEGPRGMYAQADAIARMILQEMS